MLRISKLADYATMIMAHVGQFSEHLFTAKTIAHTLHLQVPTVSKILKLLVKAELLVSQRGVTGGYQLARSIYEITMAEIVSAIDGQIALTQCSQHEACCELMDHCHTKNGWQIINQVIFKALSQMKLADLIQPK